MHRLAWGALASFGMVLAVGCTSGSSGKLPPTALSHEAITNGSPDTTHQAVMFLTYQYSGTQSAACSGTVVAVKNTYGFLLTAAHCVLGEPSKGIPAPTLSNLFVIQGNNATTSKIVYPVVDFKADPNYDAKSGTYDFAMVKFNGAGTATPRMKPLTAALDNLKAGSPVEFVGYGITAAGLKNSGTRMHVNNTLANTVAGPAVSPLLVTYSEAGGLGGPCSGDSGGPALYTVSGTQYVAAVTSSGDQNCSQFGISGRVSAVLTTFINPYINGTTGGAQTCAQCQQASTTGVGSCTQAVTDCQNNTDCAALVQCFNGCAQNDQTCINNCVSQHSAGSTVYQKIGDCVCTTGCKTECASDPSCASAACGFSFSDTTCQTCMNNSCCTEQQNCKNDSACVTCVTSANPAASCSSNTNDTALIQCYTGQCATQCGMKCGFSSQDATCQTCFENNCCSEAQACAKDATCTSCITSSSPPASCSSNALATAFTSCVSQNCNSQCGGSAGAGGTGGTGGAAGATGTGGSGASGGSGAAGGSGATGGLGTGGTGASAGAGTGGAGANGASTGGTAGGNGSFGASGSCNCETVGGPASGGPAALLLGLVGLVALGRRRRQEAA